MPQPDARAMWRAKRALGAGFFGAIGAMAKNGMLERFFGAGPSSTET
jgi:hypothetical protein